MSCFPSDFTYNIKLMMIWTLLETCLRGIWSDNVLSLFTYLITNNSNFLVGLLTGIVGATQVIFTLFSALAADKLSRTFLLKIGGCVCIIGIILTSIAVVLGHYIFLLFSMIIWGLYFAFSSPAADALLADSAEIGNRSRVYSWSYTMRCIGGSVGPFVSVVMFATLGNVWKINECKIVMLLGLLLYILPAILLFLFQSVPTPNNDDSKNNSADMSARNELDGESSHGMLSNSQIAEDEEEGDVDLRNKENGKNLAEPETSNEVTTKHFLCFPSVPYVPAMIASADIISGLASGMTIKFFPIFFVDHMEMKPVEISLLYTITPLFITGTAIITQKLSLIFGRLQLAAVTKFLGISCFVVFLITWYYGFPSWIPISLYIARTSLMNSSKPLTTSAIMDTVPASQRIRWNSLEAINAASWAGSAVLGGYIIDRYGMTFNFITTIVMQFLAIFPLAMVAREVPVEGDKIISFADFLKTLPDLLNSILVYFVDAQNSKDISRDYSSVSDMEMSQHGSEKKPNKIDVEDDEDVTIFLK